MKKTAITILGWAISIALLTSLAAKIDVKSLGDKLANAKWAWLVLAAVINMIVVGLKALRWQWMMRTMTKSNYVGIFKATMIGHAGNNLLPARGGDLLKIYLLGKWANISRTMLTSVTALDKIFDGTSILILFGILSINSTFPEWVSKGTTIVSIGLAVALIMCILLLLHHRRTPGHTEHNLSKFSRLAKRLGSGMTILENRKLSAVALLLSIVTCLLQVETIRLCQVAFGVHVDFWVPTLVFVAINLAIIIPSAPSSVGPFEAAAVLAYAWLGVGTETAFSIAFMYHLIQFLPVTIIGVIFYFASGLGKKPKGWMENETSTACPAVSETK
jgi:glycosyltransferase 2 family protein